MYRNNKHAPIIYNLPPIHKWAANTVLNNKKDMYQYSKVYSCWPNCKIWMGSPPMIILLLILINTVVWLVSFIMSFLRCHLGPLGFEPDPYSGKYVQCARYLFYFDRDRVCQFILQEFIWDPYQTSSVWRYFIYAISSINLPQMIVNNLIYITIGVPFEMVFGSGRTVLLLTITSGLGSFASSILNPNGFIIGGSVFAQFFLFCYIFSRLWQTGRKNPKTLEWLFFSLYFITCLAIMDYVHIHWAYILTCTRKKDAIMSVLTKIE